MSILLLSLTYSKAAVFIMDSSELTYSIKMPDKPRKKVKFVLRWAGVINPETGTSCKCTDCKCPGCPCPLGICHCFVIEEVKDQYDKVDFGEAWMSFNDKEQLVLEFEQQTAVKNPSNSESLCVPVSGIVSFSESLCNYWGVKSISIPAGFYDLNTNCESSYGKIIVNAVIKN